MWQYNETAEFIISAERVGLSDKTREALKSWAPSIRRTPTPANKILFRSQSNSFEIWAARIPNPEVNKGKSGGFRLLYILNLKESSIYLDKIEFRADKGSKNEHPKDQQKATEYLVYLKGKLMKEIDDIKK